MRYVHTNLIARDWRQLARFYMSVFNCRQAGPERDLAGAALSAATGVVDATLEGVHLALPGGGGVTLEIFTYGQNVDGGDRRANREGLGHLAFLVDDVQIVAAAVCAEGGSRVGDVVSLPVRDAGEVTFAYLRDPEGNLIELQSWARSVPAEVADPVAWNREAWNGKARRRERWSTPVDAAAVERARRGDLEVHLTVAKPVPRAWFPNTLRGCKVLGLASGGGQQMPLFAAAGAEVTVLDQSEGQLALDAEVAEREGLYIECVRGDMRDLSRFDDGQFDLVFHPVSNCFVPDVYAIWREAFRVLRPGGILLSGFMNPVYYALDYHRAERGEFVLTHPLPYRDVDHPELAAELRAQGEPMEFGHTWEDLLGGQLDAGFVLDGFYLDGMDRPVDRILGTTVATRACKLA